MKWTYLYPILLTTCGIFIHAFGLFDIEYDRGSNASIWGHLTMLIVDSAVVLGLLLKSSGGYWLGVLLYIEQVYIQTLSLHDSGWFNTPFYLQIPVPFLCLVVLIILLCRKNEFTGKSAK